ncbi:hypothetical protein GOQ30_01100 [Flavobacterium sp. TP390]|uniref:Uncharacterized protein n=1 Tax=Flavobacterium profundi TaxID=1774945 RepID=A0A6I4IRS9_9FLAO|nr:hypothetical protein [Flavobacterium profundi]MVO07757.1 hypothetical protein [Flavobacterium profundi]
MDGIYPELIDYIHQYCSEFNTELERKARNHNIGMSKWGSRENLPPKLIELRDRHISTDKNVLKLLENGFEEFKIKAATRIYKEYKNELTLNLCPKCGKIARTTDAKQCRFCRYDWH